MAQKTILITGCSEGGLGDALAREFKRRGHKVIATARNPSKISHFKGIGIETLVLDVLSPDSIQQCVSSVKTQHGALDMLINNSGGGYSMPLSDASLDESRRLFELNVWSVLAVTQAFLPLLLTSKYGGMLVNNTSIVSVLPNPMAGIYNMSKAATAMMTDTLRLELAPFGIKVIDLKTGAVKSNFFDNQPGGTQASLPKGSIYMPAKEEVENSMRGGAISPSMVESKVWAEQVVGDLLAAKPHVRIWRGGNAWLIWFARRFFPHTFLDGNLSKMGALDVVQEKVAHGRRT